jgi:isocitrate dehydrogenase (NAD+)
MAIDVTLIPGDGIGPEITAAAVKVLEATGLDWNFDHQLGGMAAVAEGGDPMPEATLASIHRTKLALKGPLTTPVGRGFRSVNVALRKEFQLFANLRPAKTIIPGRRFDHVDIVMVRENLEGLYIGQERWVEVDGDPHGRAESVAVITRTGAERIVRYAFEYAVLHRRKKVTLVHKANILKNTSGLFLDVGREVAAEYADRIECNDLIVDNCAMQLVMRPETFDVLVTTNLFGDILSDEISGLVGGLGLAPGGNIGVDGGIFEAVHGSAPDIAGQGIANPSSLILASAMLCDHIGEDHAAAKIRRAITATIVADEVATRDLGGTASTREFGDAVAHRVA